jgi:hypothetical protein
MVTIFFIADGEERCKFKNHVRKPKRSDEVYHIKMLNFWTLRPQGQNTNI